MINTLSNLVLWGIPIVFCLATLVIAYHPSCPICNQCLYTTYSDSTLTESIPCPAYCQVTYDKVNGWYSGQCRGVCQSLSSNYTVYCNNVSSNYQSFSLFFVLIFLNLVYQFISLN